MSLYASMTGLYPQSKLFPQQHYRIDGSPGFMANLPTGTSFLDQVPDFAAVYPNARFFVEHAWGAEVGGDPTSWSWTDVTADVQQSNGRKVDISPMGRSDAVQQAQPAGCSYLLDGTSGDYSLGPQSRNFPNVKVNVPVRVSVNLTGYPVDTSVRFQGNAWSMPLEPDSTGSSVMVPVQAAGAIRRLETGTPPARPALERAVLAETATAPAEYWKLSDGSDATQFGSGVSGGHPMAIGATPTLASVAGPGGDAASFPDFVSASTYTGYGFADGLSLGTATSWTLELWVRSTKTSVANAQAVVATWHTNGGLYGALDWLVYVARIGSSEGVVLVVDHTPLAATSLSYAGSNVSIMDGNWHQVRVTAKQNSGSVTIELWVDGTLRDSDPLSATRPTVGNPKDIRVGDPGSAITALYPLSNTASLSAGHVQLYGTSAATDHYTAGTGYVNETAVARLVRLGAEHGVPIDIIGTSDTLMGPQRTDTFMNLVRDVEVADLGSLGDGRGPGLWYVTRQARYNQAVSLTLSATASDFVLPFEPQNDDQATFNRFVVTRVDGATGTFEDATGPLGTRAIGTKESTPPRSLNLADDADLGNVAAWLVHLYTTPGYRYPTFAWDVRRRPAFALAWLALDPGNRLQLTGVGTWLDQHPAEVVDVLAEGWSESLSRFFWDVNAVNCMPAAPWQVAVLEGAGGATAPRLRWDSALSSVATNVDQVATSLSVACTGVPWTTTATFPADFPFDVEAVETGEQLTVSAIVGAASPQTFTVTRSVNGVVKPIPAGTQIRLWRPATWAL